jgi:cell shape-determining protein MreC
MIFYIPGGRRNTFLDGSQNYLKLTIENSERCVEINELKNKIEKLQTENRKLQSELNCRKNTVEL